MQSHQLKIASLPNMAAKRILIQAERKMPVVLHFHSNGHKMPIYSGRYMILIQDGQEYSLFSGLSTQIKRHKTPLLVLAPITLSSQLFHLIINTYDISEKVLGKYPHPCASNPLYHRKDTFLKILS